MTQPSNPEPHELRSHDAAGSDITGTPARPDFKPRRGILFVLLALYATFVTLVIVWAVQLRKS